MGIKALTAVDHAFEEIKESLDFSYLRINHWNSSFSKERKKNYIRNIVYRRGS